MSCDVRIRAKTGTLFHLNSALRNTVAEAECRRIFRSVPFWQVVKTLLLHLNDLQSRSQAALVLNVLSYGGLLVISGRDRFRHVGLLCLGHRRPI